MGQDCTFTSSLYIAPLTVSSVVFQWSISYMISPDAANLGLKAIYIWAGLLVPTTVLLYLYYPEVSPNFTLRLNLTRRRTVDHTKSLSTFACPFNHSSRADSFNSELYERKIPAWRFKNTKTQSDESGNKNRALQHYGH
jgi:SP family general alpha glucoside:H+ symporter-like MFS transporter